MARRDLSTRDVSDYATGELEYVLEKEKKSEPLPTMSVAEAMAAAPVYRSNTSRNVTRVLFISTDSDLLNPTTQTLDGYVDIADLFDEVHILVMRTGIAPKNPILRASKKVWIYTATADSWWKLPGAGFKMIEEQLAFASGFRPDLIVARDPIESAWLASKVAKKYDRPAQLHIVEDFTDKDVRQQYPLNFVRNLIPYLTIRKFASVRTLTEVMETKVADKFQPADLKVLPRLQNYETLITAQSDHRLADQYQGLGIFLLFIGDLTHSSGLFSILEAAKFILRNTRIGLVVIGDGPARSALQSTARRLGIAKQVVFEKEVAELLPYLKGAHILLVPDTTAASEELVLQGAAAGIPLLVASTEKRADIFANKYSAYFIDQNDTESITTGISDLLNDVEGRATMAENAQTTIKEKFLFDPNEYKAAYRLSIEEVLFFSASSPDDDA